MTKLLDSKLLRRGGLKNRTADEPTADVLEARALAPIVPPGNIAGQSLTLVISIMSFIACLTIGAVSLVDQTAQSWQSQISRETTIQIRPAEGLDMETALSEARAIVGDFEGIESARIISIEDTTALLEPWLGSGLDVEELPVPRLVVATIDESNPPDFDELRTLINEAIPNASLDDHRAWVNRLVTMARTTVLTGLFVLLLVLVALSMTVVFATRGAMAGNHTIIEVLHFIGARGGFIARQFQMRFLLFGLKGAFFGGVAAILVYLVVGWWASSNLATIEGEQVSAFFGDFAIGRQAFIGVGVLILVVGLLTAITTRLTVLRTLREIDETRGVGGGQV